MKNITKSQTRNINGGTMYPYKKSSYIVIRPVMFPILKHIVKKKKWISSIMPLCLG